MNKIIFFILLSVTLITAQGNKITPSFYYTSGYYSGDAVAGITSDGYQYFPYSGDRSSSAKSGYITATFNTYDYFVVGYDDLKIEDQFWNYDQKFYVAGIYKSFYPFGITFNYGHIAGDYTDKVYDYDYSDYTNIYNIDLRYFTNNYYFRLSSAFESVTGYEKYRLYQNGVGVDFLFSYKWFFEIMAYNTYISKRKQTHYSLSSVLNYKPLTNLSFTLEGFIGKRVSFFNSDKLTIFNQDAVQNYLYALKVDYQPVEYLNLSAQYQYTEFDLFKIKYLVGGIKIFIPY